MLERELPQDYHQRAIGESMFGNVDDNLKVEERLMKLTYAPPEGTQTAQQQIQIDCPKIIQLLGKNL